MIAVFKQAQNQWRTNLSSSNESPQTLRSMDASKIYALDHVQLAMPIGQEDLARAFYVGVLGLFEQPKPAHLRSRGGVWFTSGTLNLHLGVDREFRATQKAHPGLLVCGIEELAARCIAAGYPVVIHHLLKGDKRGYVSDPFGNRIELLESETIEIIQPSSAASLSDIPLLVELMTEFYAEANYPLDRQWATNSFTTILDRPNFGSVWLLRQHGQPAGYLVLTIRFSMEYGGLDGFIDDLFVRSAHRRSGVASAGLSLLFAECHRRQVRALHVEVAPDNVAANATYIKFGMGLRGDRRQQLTVELAP